MTAACMLQVYDLGKELMLPKLCRAAQQHLLAQPWTWATIFKLEHVLAGMPVGELRALLEDSSCCFLSELQVLVGVL